MVSIYTKMSWVKDAFHPTSEKGFYLSIPQGWSDLSVTAALQARHGQQACPRRNLDAIDF
jgi:hypothetical protein